MNEIEFYRLNGWEKNLWFTDVNGVVLTDWAVENDIKFLIECRLPGRIGVTLSDKDRVLFELRWGSNYKTYNKWNDD